MNEVYNGESVCEIYTYVLFPVQLLHNLSLHCRLVFDRLGTHTFSAKRVVEMVLCLSCVCISFSQAVSLFYISSTSKAYNLQRNLEK